MPTSPLSPKPPMSARLNQFWANMLTPLNAYIGTGLIIVLLIMSLASLLSGGNDGRHVSVSVQDEGVSVIVGKEAEITQRKEEPEGRNNFEFKGHLAEMAKQRPAGTIITADGIMAQVILAEAARSLG